MAYYRSRRKRSYARRRPIFSRRRRTVKRYPKRRMMYRKKHKKVSYQRIKSVFPDIALSKMKMSTYLIDMKATDPSVDLTRASGSGGNEQNFIRIPLNVNPVNGNYVQGPGPTGTAVKNGTFHPATTYTTKYNAYRCHGVKVKITIFTVDPNTDQNENVGVPLTLTGFPYQSADAAYSNYWDGTSTGYNALTIPKMKYGFSRLMTAMGGKTSMTYSTYWAIPKVFGHNDVQWLTTDSYLSEQSGGAAPLLLSNLALNISDFAITTDRYYNAKIEITQYGRWEGLQADTQ